MSLAEDLAAVLAKKNIVSAVRKDEGLFLSTGMPHVDYALSGRLRNGGLKTGRMVEVAGAPSSGKTALAQHIMMEAQKAGGACAFHDHEESFMPHLFERFGGDITPGRFTLEEPESFEESLASAMDWMESIRDSKLIPYEAPLVVVFDSLQAMVPAANLERDNTKSANMREKLGLAAATAAEFPAFAKFCRRQNCLAVFLNHLKTKPGVTYGDPRYTPGGEAIDFYSSVRLFLGRSVNKDKKTKEATGQTTTMEAVKNKTHRAFEKASWEFKFDPHGTGYIDHLDSMLGWMLEHDMLETSGAYIEWEGKKLYRSQLLPILNEDPAASMEKLVSIAEINLGKLNKLAG